MPITVSVLGAAGKMGKKILELISENPTFAIAEKITRQNLDDLPQAIAACDVAIDFTAPDATLKHLEAALQAKKPLLIGTTGLTAQVRTAIASAAEKIPLLVSPNFSLGIALCMEAAARISKAIGGEWEARVEETHHIHKRDCPSGTALAFAEAVRKGAHLPPIAATRSGETIGEHTVIFECPTERIEITHTAHSRDAFARGALLGAQFLAKQKPGLYSMKDLFS